VGERGRLTKPRSMEGETMSAESSVPTYPRQTEPADEDSELPLRARLGAASESGPMREIIDIAMVGLTGGGPRLAFRAAKVLIEDSYTSRGPVRNSRLGRRVRRRGS
jgi:hypothetical protein